MAAPSPEDEERPDGVRTLFVAIGHTSIRVFKEDRGILFSLEAGFFLGNNLNLFLEGHPLFSFPFDPPEKRRRRGEKRVKLVTRSMVVATERKMHNLQKAVQHKKTNCQKRQLYGAVRMK